MSWWYELAAFAAGWFFCWKISNALLRKALREPTMTERALASMTHERLVRLSQQVVAELTKRRGS